MNCIRKSKKQAEKICREGGSLFNSNASDSKSKIDGETNRERERERGGRGVGEKERARERKGEKHRSNKECRKIRAGEQNRN